MKEKLALIDDHKEKLNLNYYLLITTLVGSIVLVLFFALIAQRTETPMFIYYVGGLLTFVFIVRHMSLQAKVNNLLYEIAAYYVLKK